MPESQFPHLSLIETNRGRAVLQPGPNSNAAVTRNRDNRSQHATDLKQKLQGFSANAKQSIANREEEHLPTISGGVPFVLQIPDQDDCIIDFIARKLNLEIVAEYEDGFLIVSTQDLDLQHVLDLADGFAQKAHGSGNMASILDVDGDHTSVNRIQRILGDDLMAHWPFPADQALTLDVSIEVASFNPPSKPLGISSRTHPEVKARKLAEHEAALNAFYQDWDDKRIQRESEIERLVAHYGGEILQITEDAAVEFPDSFAMRIRMSGKGFFDFITNFPSLFEVTVPDEFNLPVSAEPNGEDRPDNFELLAPPIDAPRLCVIDSGIQENHRWLSAAIDRELSKCFLPDRSDDDVADYVRGGGHGTRVAGACLYPNAVPSAGPHQAPFWLLNARVLNDDNDLPNRVFPAQLLQTIVEYYLTHCGARIFQHSIGGNCACRTTRMSIWAAAMDWLSYQHDVLFVQAVGNINGRGAITNPGILDHYEAGRRYPSYLQQASSRIANPAQSLQALSVGSISREYFENGVCRSLSRSQRPSAFSRTGFGLWDSIKPEVVEFGGDYAADTGDPPSLTTPSEVCPETIRSTRHGGPAFGSDAVGTSFATPKVAHIAGRLAALFPEQSPLLYRALIVNSARWPVWAEQAAVTHRPAIVRSIGFGVPDVERATENSEHRVTLITPDTYECHAREGFVFGVPIPESMRRPGEDFEVRIEVTLSYAAEPRRTRKSRRGYLGVWLDWAASKRGEDFDVFRSRVLKEFDSDEDDASDGNFSWMLGNATARNGQTDGVCRKNGTLQKDWTVARSYELPEMFGIIVRGHQGWSASEHETAKFTLAVSFEALGAEVELYQEVKASVEAEIEARARQQQELEVE
ncbi:MAG: S8 family peptidase [Luteolibacter sp.]